MGLICSWVAIRTSAKTEVLDYLGMVETGDVIDPVSRRKQMSAYQNENGWLYIFSNDFAWADQARVEDLSRFGMTLGIQTDDKVDMGCRVRAVEDGRELWAVAHVNEAGQELVVTGDPPQALADIRRKYETLQAEEDDADYLSEIPLELARKVSGFRVDEDGIDFIALSPVRVTSSRSGMVSRLFSLFR